MAESSVRLWPRWEPLAVAVLPVPPAKLGIRYLRKVSAYLWARAQDGVLPRLTWSLWRRLACAKLQLPEHTAWVYFEVFDSLSPEFTVTDRLERAEQLSQCSNEGELEVMRLSVDTMTFLLFLLMQQTQRISLRSSLNGDDNWPGPGPGPSMPDDGDNRLVTQNKFLDDRHHLSFILSSFSEALRLLLPPDESSVDGLASVTCLSHQAVKALNLLVEGRVSPVKNVLGLSVLAALPGQRGSSGWLGPSQGFEAKSLEFWTRTRLSPNPCSLSSCMQYGRQLSWAEYGTTKRARVAFCSHSASKVLLLSDLSGQTVARSSARLTGAHVVLHRCSSAYIYLLSPMRSVTLNRCRRLQLVLGPVETSVRLCGCREVTVAAACRRLGIAASSSCTLHLLTPSRPLVFAGNEGLKFAPFHVYYPLLEEHMAYCGLATIPNLWDNLLQIQPMPYGLLPPDDLHPLSVPFAMSGLTNEIPGGLPKIYQKAVDKRQRRVHSWERLVREAKLSREQRTVLKDSVEQVFYTWLQQMGFKQQLDSLLASGAPADKT
uniref:TBCC domain containing 1 n=1 Tax=Eptatretus burgeri TaxID=7764 RepID=A0A8C4NC72_EPTBU